MDESNLVCTGLLGVVKGVTRASTVTPSTSNATPHCSRRSLYLLWSGLTLPEEVFRDLCALLPELGAEGAVDDDVDGGVDDEEEVADAREVVGPFRKRLHAATGT